MSQKSILRANILAIQTAKKINEADESYIPTTEEIRYVNAYKGFGGIKSVLFPLNENWSQISNIGRIDLGMEGDIKAFRKFLDQSFDNNQQIWDSIKESVLTSFYTPAEFVDAQISNIHKQNPANINSILDPCAGNGVYVDAFLAYYPEASVVAIEQDFLSAYILKAKYRNNTNVRIYHSPFEDILFREKFDLVASNIPFGNFPVFPKHTRNYPNDVTGKIHNFFFHHSLNLLNEGGALSFVTSTGVMNSANNIGLRRLLAEKGQFRDVATLPNNLFKDAGTEVTTHLVNIVRNDNPNSQLNQPFIDTTDKDGITINGSVNMNPARFFPFPPQIQTNPYGTNEFSYKADLGELIPAIETQYVFPPLRITGISGIDESELRLRNFPFENIATFFDEQSGAQNVRLLQGSELLSKLTESELTSFKNLAIIGVNYEGSELPAVAISKYIDVETGKKNYIISSYIERLGPAHSEPIKSANAFRLAFDQLTAELVSISKSKSLKVLPQGWSEDEDSQNFITFFSSKFNQPILTTSFVTEFYNFEFHKEPSVGMLVFNEYGIPARITDISYNRDNDRVFKLEQIKTKGSHQELLHDYLQLYDAYNLFISSERNNAGNLSLYRERLNKVYDSFVVNQGYINELSSLALYDKIYLPLLKSLEKDRTEIETQQIDLFTAPGMQVVWSKSDIFFEQEKQEQILDLPSALARSFNSKGRIDISYISELTGVSQEEAHEGLKERIILNPISGEYELSSQFFAGNIREKIAAIRNLPQSEDTVSLISRLEEILPPTIPFEAIKIQMGARWVPLHVLQGFIETYFEQQFHSSYHRNTDSFLVNPMGSHSSKYNSFIYQGLGSRYIRPEDLISNAFYDQYPIVTYTTTIDGERETHTDHDATNYYKREIGNLRREFVNYLFTQPQAMRDALVEIYNDTFNSTVVPQFDNDILDFSEFELERMGISQIYDHQKRAVWKMMNNEGGVVDHEVGLGKTFEIIATAHFGKKLGVFQKPIIMGIKANTIEIARTYRSLLPNANILFATEKDYESANRQVFLNKIKNNNYDCVIMSHDNFEKIPQSLEVERDIMEQELQDIEANLYNISEKNYTKQQLRGMEQRKKTLTANLSAMQARITARKDKGVLEFTDLGIDHIIVDESHKFKNLMFQTRHNRVAGLGTIEGSQRANNLLTAIRTIQQNTRSGDYGATFFSGTVISNSLTELYLVQKYLIPNVLKTRGIYNFDAWCSTFAEKSVDFETNVINELVSKERFRYFINLPELSLMYNEMADIMTGDLAKIDRPLRVENLFLNEQTPMQRKFYVKLANFISTHNQVPLKLDEPLQIDSKGSAISLLAMNLAFKASLDMRLISSRYPDEPGSKINELVKNTLSTYHRFDADKGTQIIFCDIGTSKKKLTFEELDENYKNGIFTSIYDDIKYKLMRAGIPESEIAFVQDYNSQKKREILNEKMNSGEIRFLIGGSENAGTGLNVQQRLSKIWHLTIPWKPSEISQRNGRGHRKGNLLAKFKNDNQMEIGFCATRNTLDNYRIDINKHKQGFVDQIKGASIGQMVSRHVDEGNLSEDTGMNLAELQAQLTGDNTLLKLSKVEGKIKELEQEKIFILTQNRENEDKIQLTERKIREFKAVNALFFKDFEKYSTNVQFDAEGKRVNNPKYHDLTEDVTPEQIFNYFVKLTDKVSQMSQYEQKVVAEMYGFELFATNHPWDGVQFQVRNQDSEGGVTYSLNKGKMNLESSSACSTYFVRCFDMIEKRMKSAEQNIAQEEAKISVFRMNVDKGFDKQDVLDQLYMEKEELQEVIKSNQNRDKVQFDTKSLVIDGDEREFKVIETMQQLHYAILHERLGNEHTEQGVYLAPDLADLFNSVADQENSALRILNQQPSGEHDFVKFRIYDYDLMYSHYDAVEKHTMFSLVDVFFEHSDNENGLPLVTTDDKTYYCYGQQAEILSKTLSIPTVSSEGRVVLPIPSSDLSAILAKLAISKKINVHTIRVDNTLDHSKNYRLKF